jgi:hypothetical protein
MVNVCAGQKDTLNVPSRSAAIIAVIFDGIVTSHEAVIMCRTIDHVYQCRRLGKFAGKQLRRTEQPGSAEGNDSRSATGQCRGV